MIDLATATFASQGPIAIMAVTAIFKLGGESSFGKHSETASNIASHIFDHLSGELEKHLASLVDTDLVINQILDEKGNPANTLQNKVRLNENFRNALDDYLTNGGPLLLDYRKLKEHATRVTAWCKQLRLFIPLILGISLISLAIAFVARVDLIYCPNEIYYFMIILSFCVIAGGFYYAIRILVEKNPISDLERKYENL